MADIISVSMVVSNARKAVVPTVSRRNRFRTIWLALHRYLAFTVGFLFVLMGLTGSVNVFWKELDELFNPELIVARPQGEYRPLKEILQALHTAHPALTGSWDLRLPYHTRGMLTAWCLEPPPREGQAASPLMVSVNSYTAEVVKSRYWDEALIHWNYDLHWQLLLGETGTKAVGVLALLLMLSLSTGLYLWWPRGGKFRQALTLKRGASGARFIFDLHRMSGIYGIAVLFILAFSGLYLVYSEEIVVPLVKFFSPVQEEPHDLHSTVKPGGRQAITVDQAVATAKRVSPQATLVRVVTPEDPTGVFLVNLREAAGDLNETFPMTRVWVDQYTNEVLAVRDPRTFSPGDVLLNVLFAFHNGEALGLPGRILVCLTGFVPLVLYVTGLVHWLRKRRARRAP